MPVTMVFLDLGMGKGYQPTHLESGQSQLRRAPDAEHQSHWSDDDDEGLDQSIIELRQFERHRMGLGAQQAIEVGDQHSGRFVLA